MSDAEVRWLVAYDISSDGRRAKVSDYLQDRGVRVNYSVFEILMSKAEAHALGDELHAKIDSQNDRIRIYRLCRKCARETIALGSAREEGAAAVFVD